MPVFSLPSEYGIGDFGKGCYQFIDYLKACGQKIWQILPLVQTGYGNSPYSSVSSKSFSPYFISPELLVKDGLLTKKEIEFSKNDKKYIDYGFLYAVRFPMLKKAFERFDKCDENFVKYVKSKKNLSLDGLHCHVGSQIFENKSFFIAVEKMTDFYKLIILIGKP